METFSWKVCILDDQPIEAVQDVNDTCDVLEGHKISCYLHGKGSDFSFLNPATNLQGIANSHFFLIDMKWEPPSLSYFFCRTPQFGRSFEDRSLNDELRNFAEGLNARFTPEPGAARPELNPDLPAEIMGVWIACAVSYLNPTAHIYFFSGFLDFQNDLVASILLRFSSPPVKILQKLRREEVMRFIDSDLRAWQMRALQFSESAYGWFAGKVLLPVLLGNSPIEGEAGQLYLGDQARSWKLNSDFFFPQWNDWTTQGVLLENLAQFIKRDNYRRPAGERMAISSVRHYLKDCQEYLERSISSDDVVALIDLAIDVSYSTGLAAPMIIHALEAVRKTPNRLGVQTALRAVDRAASNSLRDLYECCATMQNSVSELTSHYVCASGVSEKPSVEGFGDPEEPDLPFDLHHFRRAVEALITNARKYPTPNMKLLCNLDVEDHGTRLLIKYTDNSIGFDSIDDLSSKVQESLKARRNALMRGLPMVLCFGAFYPLTKLEIKLNDGGWAQLLPEQNRSDEGAQRGFGIRWTFRIHKGGSQ